MTPDQLEKMAREARLVIDGENVRSPFVDSVALVDLARFAALVRTAAMEEAAQVCMGRCDPTGTTDCSPWVQAAVDIMALAQQAGGEPAS